MKPTTTLATLALALAALAVSGCSKKEEQPQMTEADVKAAADNAAASSQAETEKKLDEKLASGFAEMKEDSEAQVAAAKADMEAKLAEEKAQMQAEMEAKLAEQSAALKEQFEASNQALRTQLDSLTSKYNSVKDKLPEDVVNTVSTKLPELQGSVATLEGLASKFDPDSMQQLEEFKTKYQDELATAKKIADELLKLVGSAGLESLIPKF